MTFHESSAFGDAILAASESLQIRPVLIEKDYWVTYILKNLSLSAYSEKVVFKGGTSLSKGYDCIKRFSEDIDLALLPQAGLTGNQVKNLLSKIDHTITFGLEYVDGEKRGRNRTSSYNYSKVLTTGEFGAVKEHIKVEINSFTNPVPHSSLPISSYLYQFLLQRQNTELIRQYNLEPFSLYVLSLERTFFEKLLSLNRLSYNGIETLKTKIRHFYDLHELYHNTHLKDSIFTDQNFEILNLVKLDDESIQTFHGEWMGKPFVSSPLFSSLENAWNNLSPQYLSELGNLIWADKLPEPAAILAVMQQAKNFLEQYDERKS